MKEYAKSNLELAVKELALQMIQDILADTNHTVNMHFSIYNDNDEASLYDGASRWDWYYIHGKECHYSEDPSYQYEYELYDHYTGTFW